MTSHAQIANAARPTDRRLLQSFTPSTASLFEVRSLSVWMTVDETSVTQMATAGSVERQIARVEGFEVRFVHASGRRVRADKRGFARYPYSRRARDASVAAWRKGRVDKTYPGCSVEVLDGSGRRVHGKALLSTVRASYA